MANIHDLAREFLAGEGIKMSSTQSRAIFLFADWLLEKQRAAQQSEHSTRGSLAQKKLHPKSKGCEARAQVTQDRQPDILQAKEFYKNEFMPNL
jgi:hypothetical protein